MHISQTKDIRANNKLKVINTIRKYKKVSRAKISRVTELNKATVSSIVTELMADNLVYEVSIGDSSVGRKPILITLRKSAGYTIAIDLNVNVIEIVVCDLYNNILKKHPIKITNTAFEENYNKITQTIDNIIETMPKTTFGLIGIGISVRGVVHLDGVIRLIAPLKWTNVDIKSMLQKRYNVDVVIDNDGNFSAAAEHRLNPEFDEMVVITIDEVITTGIISHGKLLKGYLGFAGAAGHTIINCNEKKSCTCGKKGCWEQYCSNTAIINLANSKLSNSISSMDEFLALADSGNEIARKTIDCFIKYLALGLENIIYILNSETVILNSPILNKYPYLINNINKKLRLPITKTQKIIFSQLGNNSALMGASNQSISTFFVNLVRK